MESLWGIDMGGTKIEGIILNSQTGETISRLRVPTEGHLGYEHVLGQINKLVNSLKNESDHTPEKIGMGTPGTMDPILNVMKNCNSTSLNGKNLQADISKITGIPFILSNDANCFAVAETKLGIIKQEMPDAKVVFGVIMGTGVGGGLVVNGKVLGGRQGIGGEWGHNHLDDSGGLCYCGKTGCVETIISGPALEKYYKSISGEKKQLKDITASYRAGDDPSASLTMERLFTYFGRSISVVINIVDPDAIVIGGGVGNIDELYSIGVEEVKKNVFNHRLDTLFFKPMLGDSAGVFGAAFL
ncbi:MAG: ROK family protein [Saprospiraceae bacterium]|jgi:predicted NBD/HSP70 family sugar kinase|nr:ROK family protein [Saprospiraceae bacterium]MBL0026448.1 ROK family protein [Saprospiraceae bacterium]